MKLTINSICLISSIIDKINLDEKFINEMINLGKINGKNKETKEKIQTQIGMKIMLKIGSKLHLAKGEIIDFIASYKDISQEEAQKEDIVKIIKELIKDKDFLSFFKQAAMSK